MAQATNDIEKRLWAAADELRANPVLGVIFQMMPSNNQVGIGFGRDWF